MPTAGLLTDAVPTTAPVASRNRSTLIRISTPAPAPV